MTTPQTDIWQFQSALSTRLRRWAGFNISAGLNLAARKYPFWQGFGVQCAGWGLINAALAWFGARNSRRKAAEDDAHSPERQEKERHALARLLWVNTGLDILYITVGLILASTGRQRKTPRAQRRQGHGWGIVLQGAFLLGFDSLHALRLGDPEER